MKKTIYIIIYLVGLIILLWSVVLSGYKFQFNSDELFNANITYLLLKGFRPYADFYLIYAPILHWLLAPVFLLFGFTFKAVSMARILMIVFFLTRFFLMYLLVAKVFGKRTGLLFIPLYLLNPFVVFAEMQIRPENLMMVFFALALLIFTYAFEHRSPILFFLTGLLMGLTLITNIKIVPSLTAFAVVFFAYFLVAKNIKPLFFFSDGFILVCFLFIAYFFFKGYVGEMFFHIFLDPVRHNNSIANPTWLGYFYFSNPVIYGQEGNPMNWIYAWSLPVLAFSGGYQSLFINNTARHSGERSDSRIDSGQARMTTNLMKIILFLSLVFQWISMLFINSVFIQYYVPLNWLYSVFAAYMLNDLLFELKLSKLMQKTLTVGLLIIFLLLYQDSVKGNISRSRMTDDPIVKETQEFWSLVPKESPAFPNLD